MKIGFISDIHGNVLALQAVLRNVIQEGGVDAVVCAGDMVAFGPRPVEVLQTLQEVENLMMIQGNTERWLQEVLESPEGPWSQPEIENVAHAMRWTIERIGEDTVRQLATLGKAGTLQVDGHPIEVEHASPGSDWVGIQPGTRDEQLEEMFRDRDFHCFVCGHTHKPLVKTVHGILVVNVGSVGYPYDRLHRPSWVEMTTSPERIDAVIHRVLYDREAVKKDIQEVAMPFGDVMCRRLDSARM